jgi:acyl transferase domain-containing protein/aryl carrier-like protein
MTVRAAASGESARERTARFVTQLVQDTLKLKEGQINLSRTLGDYGVDSLLVTQLAARLRAKFPQFATAALFEQRNLSHLVDLLVELDPHTAASLEDAAEASMSRARHADDLRPEPPATVPREHDSASDSGRAAHRKTLHAYGPSCIAVVGLSGRYPEANDMDDFWRNLKEGRNSIREVPAERWSLEGRRTDDDSPEGSGGTSWGGFIADADAFDAAFFRIPPRVAMDMDPQERLFLQEAYASIEDAGYTPDSLCASRRVGVFVGVMNSSFAGEPKYWSIANRVSFLLDFRGPSVAFDTACSSSLTAIHFAIDSLNSRGCDCAIAGGVNLILHPKHIANLSAIGMLSKGGECRPFGAAADGMVDGEGVGAVVLKRLEDAVADRDHIYGVLAGSAINSGGRTSGYTVPNPAAQAELVADALTSAGFGARALSYVEAHGTGTALGDPVEVLGLSRAFAKSTSERQFCALGSVKSNIGHAESAAGIAGLSKVLLQLEHRQLVPSLHASPPNPHIDFEQTPFKVQTTLSDWAQVQEAPRSAGIASFGAGGANAYLVVTEYVSTPKAAGSATPGRKCVVLLSARNDARLEEQAVRLAGRIAANHWADDDLPDIAYTLQVGREAMEHRIALIVGTMQELQEKLLRYANGALKPSELFQGVVKRTDGGLVAHVPDESSRSRLDREIVAGELATLAELWCKGLVFDWRRLHAGQMRYRRSMPTYPFARDRHRRAEQPSRSLTGSPTAADTRAEVESNERSVPDRFRGPLGASPGKQAARELELRASLGELLCLVPEQIDLERSFMDQGLDSILAVKWLPMINARYGTSLTATRLFDVPSIRELARYLEQELAVGQRDDVLPSDAPPSASEILEAVYQGRMDVAEAERRFSSAA